MDVLQAIAARRSVKRFTPRPVSREEMERLLEAAVQAPNHRRTKPWRFHVLGEQGRRGWGEALGARKAKKLEDADAKQALITKIGVEHVELPSMLIVAMALNENPEIREEDYAATMMAVQNISLACLAMGLGAHIRTGAVMDDPAARAAAGVPEGERIIAMLNMGEPADEASERPERNAAEVTSWGA
ncbi:MAG: nitroreductase [Gemmatimonadaceae bacterium]